MSDLIMNIVKLDHLVLTVASIERSCEFYTTVLGMEKEMFSQDRVALKYGAEKINLHRSGNEIEPKANHPTPGSADLCFITDVPLNAAMRHVKNCGIEIIDGPVERVGATGEIISCYFRDPDMNLIELANKSPKNR